MSQPNLGTESGRFEIWARETAATARHKIAEYPTEQEADKAWKRMECDNNYELRKPTTQQQLANRLREIENKGKALIDEPDNRTFQQICLDKIAQKKKEYTNLEKMERNKKYLDLSEEKKKIQYGIAGIKWALTAYEKTLQMELMK